MKIDFDRFSSLYSIRRLTDEDIPAVYALCVTNPYYYDLSGTGISPGSILDDMALLPPGRSPEDKYYVGFYEDDSTGLTAIMDLVSGYPREDTAYIGFFMVDGNLHRQGIGTRIINDVCRFLRQSGFSAVRLSYMTANKPAAAFWQKNAFITLKTSQHDLYGELTTAVRILR